MSNLKRLTLMADLAPRSVHCGTVIELPDGSLLAAAYAFSYETSADTTIITERFDGHAWGKRQVAVDIPGIAVGNPVLWLDERGTLQLYFVVLHGAAWTDAVLCVQESTDGGHSWGAGCVLHKQRGLMTKTRPLVHNDNLLLPVYDEKTWCSHVLIRSVGERDNWQLYGDTTSRGRTIQPAVVSLGNGALLMYSRSPRGHVQQSLSFNGGYSWTASQPTTLPNPNSGIDMLPLTNGRLLLVYNPDSVGRERLAYALSDDDGLTWTPPALLEDARGEYSYPYMMQARNGAVHLLYTQQRTRLSHVVLTAEQLDSGLSAS